MNNPLQITEMYIHAVSKTADDFALHIEFKPYFVHILTVIANSVPRLE